MLISIGGITEQRCLNLNRFDLVITVLYGKGRSKSQTQNSVVAVLREAWPFPSLLELQICGEQVSV